MLQRLCGVPDDGKIGDTTLAAVHRRDPKALIEAICHERLAFLQTLRTWPVFGKGWSRRVLEVRAAALAMAGGAAAAAPKPAGPGKGHVTPPRGPVWSGIGAVVAAAVALRDWVGAHPIGAAMLALVVVGAIAVAARVRHRTTFDQRQGSPTPEMAPVPPSQGATP